MEKYTTNEKSNLAAKLARLCVEITEKTKAEAWFDYMGSIDCMDVYIYPEGWNERVDERPQHLTIGFKSFHATENEIKEALEVLEGLLKGAK